MGEPFALTFTLSLTGGTSLEIDAIPDIRVQCARLSKQLLG
jgi:uncharacterized NAD(P)/FAD-binding protein YdhS